MTFRSIVFDTSAQSAGVDGREQPAFFADLNLDQIVASVTAGREEYNLEPLFFAPLRDPEAVRYRHEVLRDLGSDAVLESVRAFAKRMHAMRRHLEHAQRFHYAHQQESWFLDAVELYCDAVTALAGEFGHLGVESRGFRGLARYLSDYAGSDAFAAPRGADARAEGGSGRGAIQRADLGQPRPGERVRG